MKELLGFIAVMAALFFGIGETKGWTVGLPSQMPVMVYKSDGSVLAKRRLTTAKELPFEMKGEVKNGRVTVRAFHQKGGSFQSGQQAGTERPIFDETFTQGQTIRLNELFRNGDGNYRIELAFDEATGVFNVTMPKGSEL